MEKKYTVFISSTFEDLKEAREEVMKAVLSLRHIPLGMEIFGASSDDSWKYISRQIDQADYYIVIVAGKYGSTNEQGVSYTELEYDYATSKKIPTIALLISSDGELRSSSAEQDYQKIEKIAQFKNKIGKAHLFDTWINSKDLRAKATSALANIISDEPREGWIRHGFDDREKLLDRINELSTKMELATNSTNISDDYSYEFSVEKIYEMLTSRARQLGHTLGDTQKKNFYRISMSLIFHYVYTTSKNKNLEFPLKLVYDYIVWKRNYYYEAVRQFVKYDDGYMRSICDEFLENCEVLKIIEPKAGDDMRFTITDLGTLVYKEIVIRRMYKVDQ